MFAIFAMQHSSAKAICWINDRSEGVEIQKKLNARGGNWLRVDELKPTEVFIGADLEEYKGFNPDIDRYATIKNKAEL